ncbi:16S rRNA (uracil(1498)-N(3))-methyltransferase [Neptuniibacter sp. 2_MG-2023]|jgi:16S rRNA (uracil1498-N3)-methyltransferase|uniref:16S rRNA (uracil(1498)-N(3))-methyltransferase n=1 Tax=Neptuniibacter sp. 2_MG-2023 TaxID=3062671 RepID=UPI0026E21119|nr:16S rRNA (uracil(1498)-N(3))-methyltransferase [Neptuniibacter sp. 2_MG-2023]MDO6515021.1 16S rRNA (uracil(1498)-N(3))-methyltransferase [Neptuniibacter sp. 2_MG-2023]
MRIPRFYDPQPLSEGDDIELSDDVVQHVSRALRMKPGEYIILFNGDGFEYKTQLTHVEKRTVHAHIQSLITVHTESPLQINIGQCISRGERMDYAVQKSTEMGAQAISPLFSERCEVKLPKERQAKRISHWTQIAVSACEQSGRVSPPEITAPTQLKEWLLLQDAELKLVLHHHSEQPLQEMEKPNSVALLIGPEGGLTEEEVELAVSHGFKPLTLGPRVMRTETAPVAALTLLNYLWGDLS